MDSHQGYINISPFQNAFFIFRKKKKQLLGLRSPHHLFITNAKVPEVVGIKKYF